VSHLSPSDCETNVAQAIYATPEELQAELADIAADEAQTNRTVEVLKTEGNQAYDEALAHLREDTRHW
jgi:hypothetical protein